jgi:7-cyano-7-deazaguanine synthase
MAESLLVSRVHSVTYLNSQKGLKMRKVVSVVSGGLDSTVLVHFMKSLGYDQAIVSLDYGQKHSKELDYAKALAQRLGYEHVLFSPDLKEQWQASSLIGPDIPPAGHYASPTMASTIVPNRNMLIVAMAATVAVRIGAEAVVIGVHAGDHPVYPDCRPAFIAALSEALQLACNVRVLAPFESLYKADIVNLGNNLNVDFAQTWSCYRGDEHHCGVCGTCVERREAFVTAGVVDPTVYENS